MATYQCTFADCDAPTESHYCIAHRRWCSECGREWSAPELLDGRCQECHRIDFGAYEDCDNVCCVENRAQVTVEGVSRW